MFISSHSQLLSCLNPEQRLLISACSPEKSYGREELKELLVKPFSWERLIALSERHRLLPMLYKNLRTESRKNHIEIPTTLKEKYNSQTQHVLKLALEGLRVSSIFTQEGIPNILLKGPFLSQQIYGDTAIRPSRDIDVLVSPENILRVNEILLNEGYRMVYPDFELSKRQRNYYQKHKNQYAYRNLANGFLIELHWRLFSQKRLLPVSTDQVFAESQEYIMAGKPIRLLSNKLAFEYLCIHGSIHQWFRLLWLRDIVQLIGNDKGNMEVVLSQARKNGNERPTEQALILADLFFGEKGCSANIKSKGTVKSIASHAVLAAISDEKQTLTHSISRLRLPIYKMKLKRGLQYKLSCWSILHPNFSDWKKIKLPDHLFFLYFFLRPFLWFYSFYIKKPKRSV